MTKQEMILALLRDILEAIVYFPDAMRIRHEIDDKSVDVIVRAHAADTPLLIGKGRATHRALDGLMQVAAERAGIRFRLAHFEDPIVGKPHRFDFKANPAWPHETLLDLLKRLVRAVFQNTDDPKITEAKLLGSRPGTKFKVHVSIDESPALVAGAAAWINGLWHTMGQRHGHGLAVDIVSDQEPQEKQPETAGGRFAGI